MPKRKSNNAALRPYKEIIITVHENFIPRLRAYKSGHWSRGVTSNLSKYAYIVFLLEVNEYLPKEHKLTDYQIARCIASEFPKWKRAQALLATQAGHPSTEPRDTIAYYRRQYNGGKLLTSSPGRKGPISFKYNSQGERITNFCCRGATPNLLPEKELTRILRTYGPDNRQVRDFDFAIKETPKPDIVRHPRGPKSYATFDWCI